MDTVEALLVGDIVAYYRCSCISIVEGDHGAEALRAASVPNVKLDLRAVSKGDCLLEIGTTNGYIVTLREQVLAIALSDTRFANTTISQEDDLSFDYLSSLIC